MTSPTDPVEDFVEARNALADLVGELVHPDRGCERLPDGRWAMSADDMHMLRALIGAMERTSAALAEEERAVRWLCP